MLEADTKDSSAMWSRMHSLETEGTKLNAGSFVQRGTVFESDKLGQDGVRKSFRKVNDIFNTLPVHFTGKVRDIDNLLAKVIVEVHSALVLIVHEVSVVDPSLLNYLEESEDWENLISGLRKSVINFRKEMKKQLHAISAIVELPEESKFNIESFINMDSKVIGKVTGVTDFPLNLKKSLSEVVTILGTEAESKIDHITPDNTIKMLLTNLENDTNYVEDWFLKKTEKVKHDIIKCWNLLKRENEEEIKTDSLANFNHDDSSLLVRQLKSTFKFYNSYKLTKNILNLESTMHRVVLTADSKFVYAAGNGCKVRKREMNVQSNNIFTDKKYNVFGIALDSSEKCWIHDGHTNQIIGFDMNLKERCLFTGICFNQCGFASTDATFITKDREKLFWHKGKGRLSCIVFKEERELEYSDVVTKNDFIRKMEATSNEQTLIVLDSDFLTFNMYNLKKQERFKTIEYKNELLDEPKVFSFTLSVGEEFIVIVGDHKAKVGADKRRKKEAFVALHRNSANMEHLQTLTFPELEKNFISITKDPESGVFFASEYGSDILVLRLTSESLHVVQQLKGIHVDYPFHTLAKSNRLYTCSLSQGMSAVEFAS